jgi:hypothetical protein
MFAISERADTRNRNVGLGDGAGLTVLLEIERLDRDRTWWAAEGRAHWH